MRIHKFLVLITGNLGLTMPNEDSLKGMRKIRRLNDNKEFCRFCRAALQDEPIPEEIQHHYGATHFTRKVGISSIEEGRIVK
ncbi:hypothetical protein GCM10008983_28070 [Lentibacillus halophilus]|uniref:Uncharacterized protein n=1 Tax=Lentibacillus halophilus TaxID=295065 RepID=A0ABP3JBR9_9BACI